LTPDPPGVSLCHPGGEREDYEMGEAMAHAMLEMFD
jgi:hypothetical protein